MDLAHAIIAAQVRLNEITNNDKRVCIIHRGIQGNDFGWLIPWANKEVVTQGSSALTVGGNLPFFSTDGMVGSIDTRISPTRI